MFIMITFFLSVELIVLRKIFIVSVCTHPVENYVYLNFPFFFYVCLLLFPVVRARALLSMGKTEEAIRDLEYAKKAFPCTVISQEYDRAQTWHKQKLKQQQAEQRKEQAAKDEAKRKQNAHRQKMEQERRDRKKFLFYAD